MAVSLAISVLALLGQWAYVGWLDRQLRSFQDGAYAARRSKDWDQVSRLAAAWSQREPENALPVLMLAEAAQQQGDLRKAVDYLGDLPSEDPRTVQGLLERTNLLFGPLNQPFEGAETCKRVIRLQPANREAWQRLNFFYAVTVQRVALARSARETIRQGADTPETFIYLLGANWMTLSNGYDQTTRWLADDPDNEVLLVGRAMNFVYSSGVHEKAYPDDDSAPPSDGENAGESIPYHEQVLSDYFERFPQNCELLDFYLQDSTMNGDTERVEELLARTPPEAAEDGRFWRHQGWLLATRGQIIDAEKAYRKALELSPFDWRTRHQLDGVLRQMGKVEEAKEQIQLAADGKQLQRSIYQLPNVRAASRKLLTDMARYIAQCGAEESAARLLSQMSDAPPE